MRWLEVTVETTSKEIDHVCEELERLGVSGVCIEDEADFKDFLEKNHKYWDYVDEELNSHYEGMSRVKFYLEDNEKEKANLRYIETVLNRNLQVGYLEEQDWENGWKQYYEPIPVGNKLLIVPEWMDLETNERIVLRLDPGIAFGTGSHPTTKMCLKALEAYAGEGKKALDIGCGSGILGIGAILLGCESATGCDIDPKSPDSARMNAGLNQIQENKFYLYTGDVLANDGLRKSIGGGYNIILANIVADVIIPLSTFVRQFMTDNSVYICSGIIDNRVSDVEKALKRNGFTIIRHLQEEEWHAFVCE